MFKLDNHPSNTRLRACKLRMPVHRTDAFAYILLHVCTMYVYVLIIAAYSSYRSRRARARKHKTI